MNNVPDSAPSSEQPGDRRVSFSLEVAAESADAVIDTMAVLKDLEHARCDYHGESSAWHKGSHIAVYATKDNSPDQRWIQVATRTADLERGRGADAAGAVERATAAAVRVTADGWGDEATAQDLCAAFERLRPQRALFPQDVEYERALRQSVRNARAMLAVILANMHGRRGYVAALCGLAWLDDQDEDRRIDRRSLVLQEALEHHPSWKPWAHWHLELIEAASPQERHLSPQERDLVRVIVDEVDVPDLPSRIRALLTEDESTSSEEQEDSDTSDEGQQDASELKAKILAVDERLSSAVKLAGSEYEDAVECAEKQGLILRTDDDAHDWVMQHAEPGEEPTGAVAWKKSLQRFRKILGIPKNTPRSCRTGRNIVGSDEN